MKRKKQLRTLFLMIASIVTGASASIGFASAAFVYNQRYQTPTNFNTNNLTSYFLSGIGTSQSPYMISTPDHIRNLQKLNVLGVFSKDTHFKVANTLTNNTLTWSGDDLLPIGSDDYPFYSQFDGNGVRIAGLRVVGNQTRDIGMFGYVARGATVKNFLLNAPSIYVNSDNNPSFLSTTNPLHSLLVSQAQALTLTLTQKNASAKAYFVAAQTTVNAGGVTLNIEYSSTDTTLLYLDTANNRWTVNTPPNAQTGKFYPVQLNARVYAKYQDKIISYTLERWQINVTHDGNVNIENAASNIKQGFWKTLHDTTGDNIGSGPHETYVGFFVGHLDGEATNLGLYGGTSNDASINGKIYVSGRAARSFSTLIGYSVNDAVNDDANASLIQRYLDFDSIINENNTAPVKTYPTSSAVIPTTTAGLVDSAGTQFRNYDLFAQAISSYYSITSTDYSFVRIYPGVTNTTHSEMGQTYNAIEIKKGLEAHQINIRRSALFGIITSNLGVSSLLKNGIWIAMSTSNQQSSWFLSRNNVSYEITLRIKYVATGSIDNSFQFVYNQYKPSADPINGSLYAIPQPTRYYAQQFDSLANLSSGSIYNPANYSLRKDADGNIVDGIVEREIKISYNSGVWGFQSGYDLLLGFGVGSTYNAATTTVGNNSTVGTYHMNSSSFNLNEDGFSLKIFSIDLLFTSTQGTISRQISNVDFLYRFPTYNNSTTSWSGWDTFSTTKITFNVLAPVINTSGQYANYRFYRTNSSAGRVYGYTNNTDPTWNLANAPGAGNATLGTAGAWA